jgi:hypothetical protein
MRLARLLAVLSCVTALTIPAAATNLVTGNGFGFAVVDPNTAAVTKLYSHPYSFMRPDPTNPLSEGIETPNFLKSLQWHDSSALNPTATYEQDSHVIHLRTSSGEGFVFMPFGLSHSALILRWEPASMQSGAWSVAWNHPIRTRRTIHIACVNVDLLHFDGIDESLLLIPLAPSHLARSPGPQQLLAGSNTWALIALESDADLAATVRAFLQWRGSFTPRALVKCEIAQLDQWRVPIPPVLTADKERHLWRQCEVMLRIAQNREPHRPNHNGNGLIVASLPDGVWFTPWVRDMAWATVAFARMGHRAEARAALLAYFNAQPTGKMRAQTANADYQVSVVRYFGDGSEEPFFTMEGSTNIEYDDWGEVLWALGAYLQQYNDPALLRAPTYRGPLYESARDFIAKPLLTNLEPYRTGSIVAADTSIWEERQKDEKHFAFSTAMAIVGLQSFAEIAQRAGDTVTHKALLEKVFLLQKGFNAAFIRDGHLHGTLEDGIKNDIDGALLPILNFGLVPDQVLVRDTVQRMELLKVASGGYRRVRSTYTDPAIFEYWYERQEFLFVDIALAETLRRLDRSQDAAAILDRITGKAAVDHNIVPEMYVAMPCDLFPGQIGDPTGARPMVGYGAGAYILDVLDRTATASPH